MRCSVIQRGTPGRQMAILAFEHAQSLLNGTRGVVRNRDDQIRFARVFGDQAWKIAPHFAPRAVRVKQEIQVVDGGHAETMPRRQQDRGGGMNDVKRPRSEPLNRWPAQAVPGQIEGADGEPAVDKRRASEFDGRRRGQPVAQGTGKQRDLQILGPRFSGRLEAQQGPHQFVNPDTDARRFFQRRPIVEKQPQHQRPVSYRDCAPRRGFEGPLTRASAATY